MGEMFEQQLFTWSQVCASGPAVNILLPLEEILALAFLFARKWPSRSRVRNFAQNARNLARLPA
jgi:hypothetical protein